MTDLAIIEQIRVSKFDSKDTWEDYLLRLSTLNNGVQFLIGDAILDGVNDGYVEHGVYDQVHAITGIAKQTLKNYVAVSRKIGAKDRKPGLTFEAHKATQGLPLIERELILDEAEENSLTVQQIRDRIKGEEAPESEPAPKSIVDFDAVDTEFEEVTDVPVTPGGAHTLQDFGDTPLDVTDNAQTAGDTARYILTVAEEHEYNGQYLNEFVNWFKEYINETF